MSKQQVYGVDLDGVVANFNAAFLKLLICQTGRALASPVGFMPTCWEWPEALGYSKAEIDDAWAAVKQNPRFWFGLEAYPTTWNFLYDISHACRRDNHLLYFITVRPGMDLIRQTTRWLSLHGALGGSVLIAKHSKGLLAAGLGLTAFIDDKPENCAEVKTAVPRCRVYLLKRPWNQSTHEAIRAEGHICLLDTLQHFLHAEDLGGEESVLTVSA